MDEVSEKGHLGYLKNVVEKCREFGSRRWDQDFLQYLKLPDPGIYCCDRTAKWPGQEIGCGGGFAGNSMIRQQ